MYWVVGIWAVVTLCIWASERTWEQLGIAALWPVIAAVGIIEAIRAPR